VAVEVMIERFAKETVCGCFVAQHAINLPELVKHFSVDGRSFLIDIVQVAEAVGRLLMNSEQEGSPVFRVQFRCSCTTPPRDYLPAPAPRRKLSSPLSCFPPRRNSAISLREPSPLARVTLPRQWRRIPRAVTSMYLLSGSRRSPPARVCSPSCRALTS
jgi:hypothetical protein